MEAVVAGGDWDLIDPRSGQVKKTMAARPLFQRLLEMRIETGEPYLIFEDAANRGMSEHQRELGLKVTQSNLCSEIMLHTGADHHGNDRTAVCCLGSVNIDKFDHWKGNKQFIEDCLSFLDNVLEDFIEKTEGRNGFENARYAAMRERSVGLGAMGLHSYFQQKRIPFESGMAKAINLRVFKFIHEACEEANVILANRKGACPDAKDAGHNKRFSHTRAIAPTASISIICGGVSPCVEPWNANVFTQKTLSGSVTVRNEYLKAELEQLGLNTPQVWEDILQNGGSVQHREDIPQEIRDVFRTAFEIDQRWIIEMAGDRTEYIDQGQSINVFLLADIEKWDLLMLHLTAWRKGVKSLYYCRSKSLQRASHAGGVEKDNTIEREKVYVERTDYEECMACQ
jgi:ribonucleoside-diphosphate reductase alpha chain